MERNLEGVICSFKRKGNTRYFKHYTDVSWKPGYWQCAATYKTSSHLLFNFKAGSCVWVLPYSPFMGTASYYTISIHLRKNFINLWLYFSLSWRSAVKQIPCFSMHWIIGCRVGESCKEEGIVRSMQAIICRKQCHGIELLAFPVKAYFVLQIQNGRMGQAW